jgi:hypothetical protein
MLLAFLANLKDRNIFERMNLSFIPNWYKITTMALGTYSLYKYFKETYTFYERHFYRERV